MGKVETYKRWNKGNVLAEHALLWLIRTGDAVKTTYHIPAYEGKEGYDITIYKVKGTSSPYKPKGRRTR